MASVGHGERILVKIKSKDVVAAELAVATGRVLT
jgi:hypothetical protein